jgi:hypothetical protein
MLLKIKFWMKRRKKERKKRKQEDEKREKKIKEFFRKWESACKLCGDFWILYALLKKIDVRMMTHSSWSCMDTFEICLFSLRIIILWFSYYWFWKECIFLYFLLFFYNNGYFIIDHRSSTFFYGLHDIQGDLKRNWHTPQEQ